jgi:hypothetical protein
MQSPIRLFAGYDAREAVGFAVFVNSIIRKSSAPVSVTALQDKAQGDGSNSFTYARYRVPFLCDYEGWAVFMDGADQLLLADIAELWAMRDERYAVQVVKHPNYNTRHPIKYKGTCMECPNVDYPRKNWASVMLINCAAPEWIEHEKLGRTMEQHQFKGFADERIGELPKEWNVLIDEGQDPTGAKLLHWTAGIPAFRMYKNSEQSFKWLEEFDILTAEA